MAKTKQKSTKPIYWHCKCGDTTIKGKHKVTIIAMRHGESQHNVLQIVNGDPKSSYHLTEKGKKQAAELAKKLKNKEIIAIIASQLMRTQETVAPLAKIKKLKVQIDPRINEIHPAGLEGINILEFRRLTNNANKSVKGSETGKQIAKRLKFFLTDVVNFYQGRTIAICSSEIILHSLRQMAAGEYSDENVGKHIDNARVYEFHIHSPICCPTCGDRCSI